MHRCTLCIVALLVSIYRDFTAMIHTRYGVVIKYFCSDSRGEYLSRKFRCILVNHGTIPQLSCPYAHQQNGIYGMESIVILWIMLALLLGGFVPQQFWENVFTAVYLISPMPTFVILEISPHEHLYDMLLPTRASVFLGVHV